jgi:peptide chain release factor 3
LCWPVGTGARFRGVFDLRSERMRVFRPGADRVRDDDPHAGELGVVDCRERFGDDFAQAYEEIGLVRGAAPAFERDAFLAGRQTPLFFGSAINNFGVREVLDALVELAPPPGTRPALQRQVHPREEQFSAVVFKIQANMDPAHRDRVAFLRVCSGRFERGMRLTVVRTGKAIRPASVVSFLSQRREQLDVAHAGDIIGIPNRGTLQLGDAVTEDEDLQFTGLPFFAPEMFRAVELADPLRAKQLKLGLTQLGEEGAIQVFRTHAGGALLLGAIGALQFEVVAHRLRSEYGVDARLVPSKYEMARWISADDPRELKRFIDDNAHRVGYDAVDAPTFLAASRAELSVVQERWRTVRFHGLREHAGLVFHAALEA